MLTTPLVAALAAEGPVDVVATRASAALLANHPAIREVIAYDKRGADAGVSGFVRLARALGRRGYDGAYLAHGSLRSAALAAAAGVRTRVGFDTSAGRRLYTVRVPYDESAHHARRLLDLAVVPRGRAASDEEAVPSLHPGAAERAAVDALLGAADGEARGRPLVALAPGSVWATKRWPFYAQLARRIAGEARLAVVGGPDDAPLAAEIAAEIAATPGADVVDATGRLSLLASAELVRRARVLVTNDSAPQHLASAVGTPTIAIFGPTVPAFGFGPLAPGSTTLGRETLACRPCDRHGPQRCPLQHWRCMREIGPEDVAAAVRQMLAARGA